MDLLPKFQVECNYTGYAKVKGATIGAFILESAEVGGYKLKLFQLTQRWRATSADAQRHEYERTLYHGITTCVCIVVVFISK